MKDYNELAYSVEVPQDIGIALSTGRPSLILLRHLNEEESIQVLNVIKCLMETNEKLQERLKELSIQVESLADNLKGAHSKTLQMLNTIDGGNRADNE
jgi:hypothetical protein